MKYDSTYARQCMDCPHILIPRVEDPGYAELFQLAGCRAAGELS